MKKHRLVTALAAALFVASCTAPAPSVTGVLTDALDDSVWESLVTI